LKREKRLQRVDEGSQKKDFAKRIEGNEDEREKELHLLIQRRWEGRKEVESVQSVDQMLDVMLNRVDDLDQKKEVHYHSRFRHEIQIQMFHLRCYCPWKEDEDSAKSQLQTPDGSKEKEMVVPLMKKMTMNETAVAVAVVVVVAHYCFCCYCCCCCCQKIGLRRDGGIG